MKRTELRRRARLRSKPPEPGKGTRQPLRTTRREAGFSRQVRLLVRARAAGSIGSPGEPEDAHCEGCGIWLGRYGGQVHHRLARQAGGCKLAVVNSTANALLLCGTPEDKSTCHGRATAMDKDTKLAGFVLEHGIDPALHDPRYASVMWHALGGSGVTFWLGENGDYLYAAPEASAA